MDIEKIKIGKKVNLSRRNGDLIAGVVNSEVTKESNGSWVEVNVGTKKAPNIIRSRPSKLLPPSKSA